MPDLTLEIDTSETILYDRRVEIDIGYNVSGRYLSASESDPGSIPDVDWGIEKLRLYYKDGFKKKDNFKVFDFFKHPIIVGLFIKRFDERIEKEFSDFIGKYFDGKFDDEYGDFL